MNKCCVVVADGARARLMSIEPAQPGTSRMRLYELKTMLNPEHKVHEHELFENDRHGAVSRNAGRVYTMDDHRANHEREFERRFASRIAEETLQFSREVGAEKLIIAADPRTLGLLRDEPRLYKKSGLAVTEVRRDLSKLSTQEIQDYLEHEALVA
jgi:protein required for attachment to host cells